MGFFFALQGKKEGRGLREKRVGGSFGAGRTKEGLEIEEGQIGEGGRLVHGKKGGRQEKREELVVESRQRPSLVPKEESGDFSEVRRGT